MTVKVWKVAYCLSKILVFGVNTETLSWTRVYNLTIQAVVGMEQTRASLYTHLRPASTPQEKLGMKYASLSFLTRHIRNQACTYAEWWGSLRASLRWSAFWIWSVNFAACNLGIKRLRWYPAASKPMLNAQQWVLRFPLLKFSWPPFFPNHLLKIQPNAIVFGQSLPLV